VQVITIGVDPHKESHTASAHGAGLAAGKAIRVPASSAGYRSLLRWAGQFPERCWAIEGARGLGRHLAQWLVHRGEMVVDVPATATSRVRELSRGGRRKTDVIDAAAAAAVAAAGGDAQRVVAEDHTTVCALLEERRANVAAQRVRLVNQLHAVLRDLRAGGAPVALTADHAASLIRRLRPVTAADHTRRDIAKELVGEVRAADAQLDRIEHMMRDTLDEHASSLTEIDGVGPVLAVRLVGRTGGVERFATESAFASYAGVAPIEVASGERTRHRLSRSGDRQLNSALHLIAVTQVRMTGSEGRCYFDKKIAEGKTRNEALRCLKRKIASRVWRSMRTDHRRAP
jgi:transposase